MLLKIERIQDRLCCLKVAFFDATHGLSLKSHEKYPATSKSDLCFFTMRKAIVLVDDHQIVREGLRMLLEGTSHYNVVDQVQSGHAAIDSAKRHRPHMVVMDVGLPDMDGVSTTKQVRILCPETKVLALSGYREKHRVQAMLEAGASGYVLKDAAFEELITAMHVVFGGQIYLSPGLDIRKSFTDSPLQRDSSPKPLLTSREQEVLKLLAQGMTSKEIANHLSVSIKTVETHRKQIMDKTEIRSIAGLTKWAIREGLITSDE